MTRIHSSTSTFLPIWPSCQMVYTAEKGPMALDTSLAPCVKDMTHAENTYMEDAGWSREHGKNTQVVPAWLPRSVVAMSNPAAGCMHYQTALIDELITWRYRNRLSTLGSKTSAWSCTALTVALVAMTSWTSWLTFCVHPRAGVSWHTSVTCQNEV